MHKSLGLIIIFILPLLAACNLPFGGTAQPTEDLVATQVSMNLTQTAENVQPTQVPTTAVPATPIPPTHTVAAPTETNTPTLTPEPSATIPPTDPSLSLGTPTFKDNFANGKSWGLDTPYDDGNTRVEIKDNSMVLTSYKAVGWHGWRVSYLKPKNFYLEATIKVGTCSGPDTYGLIFRSPDDQSGYWYGVTCDGQYNLLTFDGTDFAYLIKAKTSADILAGSDQTNRLGVMVQGDKIALYINGKLLEEVTDSAYPNAGTFGLWIAGWKTLDFSVACTQLTYWNLP
jgi:hypothetical protein